MIGGRRGRIVAVVRRDDDQIVLPHAPLEPRDPGVEFPQSLMKPRHIVAVPPRLVELDHVDEDEPALAAVERLLDQAVRVPVGRRMLARDPRSEEHTSELQSPCNLVCRLLLEKKKKKKLYTKIKVKTNTTRYAD